MSSVIELLLIASSDYVPLETSLIFIWTGAVGMQGPCVQLHLSQASQLKGGEVDSGNGSQAESLVDELVELSR